VSVQPSDLAIAVIATADDRVQPGAGPPGVQQHPRRAARRGRAHARPARRPRRHRRRLGAPPDV